MNQLLVTSYRRDKMLKSKELLEKMSIIAEELEGNEHLYPIFTKCMADIDNLKTHNPYDNTWEYVY